MPIDPCLEGCLNHNIGANTVPAAGDDPCNSNGNGYYCAGSYWAYDPTAGGANPAVDGDCPRLFLRTGSDCNVDQWLEIAVAEIRSETVPPVDGVDCCPPGTIWCVPAAGDVTIDQTWISTNGCGATDCTWCKICGLGMTEIFYAGPLAGIPENVSTDIPFNIINADFLDEATLPTITIAQSGCYHIQGEAVLDYTGINFEASLLRLVMRANGVSLGNMGNVGGYSLNRPVPNPITMPITGDFTGCWAAGTVLTLAVLWDTNFGGTTIDLLTAQMRVKRIE